MASKLPPPIRFPLLVLLSWGLSSLFYSISSEWTAGDLAGVSRRFDGWTEIAGLLTWRVVELGVGWFWGLDGMDLGALILLTHAPTAYFLVTFYTISGSTAITSLVIDLACVSIPFALLRPLSAVHHKNPPKGSISNRIILNDSGTQFELMILGAAIYAVVIFTGFKTWLPTYLVTHFDGLRTIAPVYDVYVPTLVMTLMPIGFATTQFLFNSTTGAKVEEVREPFNPEKATLGETLQHNLWAESRRTKVLMSRTAALVLMTGFNTWLQTYVTIAGAEPYGAAGWASVWASASALTGLACFLVGNVDGVYK
ncbi:MAG: hypothetical protein M1834_000869 [Cirrosporium novae-zelandiae]|nr:MAG: hypothetical protein M1834_000869 [Cirrosporium novae-zelandiae]